MASELFLTPKELAARLGYHVSAVYSWRHNRGMPVRQGSPNGRWTIEWGEFLEWWKKDKN